MIKEMFDNFDPAWLFVWFISAALATISIWHLLNPDAPERR